MNEEGEEGRYLGDEEEKKENFAFFAIEEEALLPELKTRRFKMVLLGFYSFYFYKEDGI